MPCPRRSPDSICTEPAVSKRNNQCLQISQRLGGWPPSHLLRRGLMAASDGSELVASHSFWYQHDLPTDAVLQYSKMRSRRFGQSHLAADDRTQ